MTAVAPPVQLQQPSRPGWTSADGQNGLGNMAQEDAGRTFITGTRKPLGPQRSNSSISTSSTASSASTLSAASTGTTNASNGVAAEHWATRKKAARGPWPPGKSEPISGLSTARPQSVSTVSGGQSAASGLSALHTPLLPSQQMSNGTSQQNGVARGAQNPEGTALLYLLPMNGTFERKTIHVPAYPDVLRIGRQTNAKTAPTPTNGFFDSKVLSRQHAEIYAERAGRVFIRDVKSSNGTFVNGKRLSPENKESEPHELREQDVLELGIDIVSEDQKTVVHHKVAARVEHAGMFAPSGEIGFGDLDPSGGAFLSQQMKRVGQHPGMPGMKTGGPFGNGQGGPTRDGLQQQPWQRMWVQPISTEQLVRRLNRELNLAKQQSQDIARAKQSFEKLLQGKGSLIDEKNSLDGVMGSPSKASDMDSFPQPPAPPPSHPLPDKPELAKSITEAIIQPFLQRADTAKPDALDASKGNHMQALSLLSMELNAAKEQIPSLQERVKALEQQLRDERTLRETAEERAHQLEHGSGKRDNGTTDRVADADFVDRLVASIGDTTLPAYPIADLSSHLQRLQANMSDMKQQMEAYRRRAEIAESQRDEARQSLADMVEQKRERLQQGDSPASLRMKRTRSRDSQTADQDNLHIKSEPGVDGKHFLQGLDSIDGANGHTVRPAPPRIPLTTLLDKAGLDYSTKTAFGRPLTRQQAVSLQAVLRREMQLAPDETDAEGALVIGGREVLRWNADGAGLAYHGIPHACALTTVVVGLVVMRWLNGWEKMQRLAP